MKTVFHKSNTRGKADFGWLKSFHSFSFGNYYNPERINFGVLRVLNDDKVDKAMGFDRHPHKNMEIISIPLKGDLEHKDSLGNTTVIKEGDIQVMSAGTGVYHSEYNKNKDQSVEFLQIWIIPVKEDVEPRYDQISLASLEKQNAFFQILSPNSNDQGVWVYQYTWFHLGYFDAGKQANYTLKDPVNGVYIFVLEGEIEVNGTKIEKRDAIGVWETKEIEILTTKASRVLLMEVPLKF